MTTIIFNSDLEALATKISYSVGETGVYITNGNLSKITRNFTTGQVEGVVVGVPAITATSTQFTGQSNYINTQIDETATMTIISIAKRPTGFTADAMAASNNGLAGNIGASLWYTSSGSIAFAAARDNGSGAQTSAGATIIPADPLLWSLCIGEAGTVNKITNVTTGQTASSPTTTARFVAPAKMCIGSSYQSVHSGAIDILITIIIPRVLSAVETNTVVAQLRAYASKYGIVV